MKKLMKSIFVIGLVASVNTFAADGNGEIGSGAINSCKEIAKNATSLAGFEDLDTEIELTKDAGHYKFYKALMNETKNGMPIAVIELRTENNNCNLVSFKFFDAE